MLLCFKCSCDLRYLHVLTHSCPTRRPSALPMPMVLGHEASAVVVDTGAGVEEFVNGDHAILVFVPNCGHCAPCSIGRPALGEPAAVANGAGSLRSAEHTSELQSLLRISYAVFCLTQK